MSKDYKDLLVALDIGTSKVVAIVAELKGEGHYEVIGLGVPKNKRTEIVYKLNKEIHACLAEPKNGAPCRSWEHGALRVTRRLRQAHHRRNSKVGRGSQSAGIKPD